MKKLKIISGILTMAILSAVGIFGYLSDESFAEQRNVTAGGSSSTDGGGGTPGCYKYRRLNGGPLYSTFDDTCFGGVWWVYDVNGNNNIEIPDFNDVQGGKLHGCVDDGAEKYYRLALVEYNTGDYKGRPASTLGNNYTFRWVNGAPDQRGLWQVWRFGLAGGNTTYRLDALDWDTVKEKFNTAVQHGASMNGNKWEEISMFCYSEKWEQQNAESTFDAWSYVGTSTNKGNYTGSSTPDYETVTQSYSTKEEKFNVTLWHQLRYNRPSVQGTYGPATTNWRTEVTIDGQIQNDKSVTSPRVLTNNDSGPGNKEWWSEYLAVQNIQVDVPESGTVEVCSRIIYEPKNIKWKDNGGRFTMDSSASNGSEDSKACAVIGREIVETEAAGQIHFFSRSSVAATGASGIRREATSYDSGDDTVTLFLSTTKSEIDATFWHELMYKYEARGGGAIEPMEAKDEFRNAENLKVDWEVYRSSAERSDGEINKIIDTGQMFYDTSYPNRNGKTWQRVSGNNTYHIRDIKEGETVVVCEEIKFEDAIIELNRDEVKRHERTYTSTTTYMGLPLYTRKDNPNPPAWEKDNDDINNGKYLFEAATIYHLVHHESTCVGKVVNGIWQPCAEGREAYDEYVSGGEIGKTAYLKTDNKGDKPFENSANFSSSGLYVNNYQPVSSIDTENVNTLGYFTRTEAKTSDGTTYYTYSSVTPQVQVWNDPPCARWNSAGGYCEEYQCRIWNSEWGYCQEYEQGYYSFRPYNKETDEGATVYAGNGEQLYEPTYDLVHDHWIYYPVEGQPVETGSSKACLSVTRPEDPLKPGDPDPQTGLPVTGPVSGSPDSGFMYAGEVGDNVSWNGYATSYATRRLMKARAIIYDPKVDVDPYDTISKGNLFSTNKENDLYKNTTDPCTWYTRKVNGRLRHGCTTIDEVGGEWGEGYDAPYSHETPKKVYNLTTPADVIVSDYVGDKFCNSFGFELEYWYGITHSNPKSEEWHSEGKSYWAIYDAACRTIAKKPSLNLWNGSLFTNGDVQTTLAYRYLNPVFGGTLAYPRGSGDRHRFGSWSEYLAVVGGVIKDQHTGGFGSGTALSYMGLSGSMGNIYDPLWNISPLTIANAGPTYGQSGVNAGSTFRARLNTYLKQLSTTSSVAGLQNVDKTIVVDASGTLDINENITLKTTGITYPSIYQLPQIIIFADDINISGNVTQIDAWLIAKNKINTCSQFVSGEDKENPANHSEAEAGTEAHIKDYNNRDFTACSKQLTINGPIVAKEIELNRSYGADPITDTDITVLGDGTNARAIPGEAFNLSADTFLWSYAQAGRYDSSYTEAYTRELPPRY